MLTHLGTILEPSKGQFDSGCSTFSCAFVDEDDPGTVYLYYTGGSDTKLTRASIGLATSKDGEHFRKVSELNPLIDGERGEFNSRQSVTPAVVRVNGHYYMFFAGTEQGSIFKAYRSKIGVACAEDPRGPWKVLGVIARPELDWEGWSIDLGPSVVDLGGGHVLVYYSNVFNSVPIRLSFPLIPRYLRRRIGILNVKIKSPTSITAQKHCTNPLKHLNGAKGSPSESLFCPGHLLLGGRHVLLPTMSTYSVGYPFHQYVGMISDSNPYFGNRSAVSILIDGPTEKGEILNARNQIALDTPSPVLRNGKFYLYYSAMDRQDGIWKTALSIVGSRWMQEQTMRMELV